MIQSEQQGGGRLILPPVPTLKQARQLPSILQMLSVLNRKREEYQSQLEKQQPSDQSYSLKYARCETDGNHLERRGPAEEESLARGSIAEHSFYRKPARRKNRLLAANITSTLEPLKVRTPATLPKRAETPHITQDRYKSLERRKEKQQQSKVASTDKEVINEQRQNEVNDPFTGVPEFAIPFSEPKRQRSVRLKTRTKAQTQKQSNATKQNSEASNQRLHMQKFKEMILDLKKGGKTNERLEKTIKALQLFNPFFRKIQRVIGVCLLRMGRVRQKLANSVLYQMDEPYSHFYVILQGEVKLTGRFGMHKICEAGETLLEEVLDAEGKKAVVAVALEKARVVQDSWILQIEREQLRKLEKELNKFGFRQGLNEMRTLIKRNSIVKTWLRNKFKLLQKK